MYPIFASFVIFVIFFSWSMHRHKNDDRLKTNAFFKKENAANETRKKSIAGLDYIKIPTNLLIPFEGLISNVSDPLKKEISSDDLDYINDLYARLEVLSNKKILNLTGISNTDLKLSYGVANLNSLSEFDQNYTILVRTLQLIAAFYYKLDLPFNAKYFLEFSVQTKSDVSSSYLLLAKIYLETGNQKQLESLINACQLVPGSQKIIIDRKLKEFCQSHDLPHS